MWDCGSGNARLTEEKVPAIRTNYARGAVSIKLLARLFDVSPGLIWQIIHRRAWAHLA